MSITISPVLQDGVLYLANDQIVCSECAGATALYSGLTIGGAKVAPITGRDAIE